MMASKSSSAIETLQMLQLEGELGTSYWDAAAQLKAQPSCSWWYEPMSQSHILPGSHRIYQKLDRVGALEFIWNLGQILLVLGLTEPKSLL